MTNILRRPRQPRPDDDDGLDRGMSKTQPRLDPNEQDDYGEDERLPDPLDNGDDVDDGDGDGDGDDGGDGDNEAPTWKTAVKRKAPKKKKKISVKKKQRKSVPITSLDEEDPLESPYSPRYKPTLEDFTLGYPPTPYDQFTLVYTPTHVEDMLHPPPSWHRTRSPFQQPPPPMSSRHEPQSRAPLTDVTDQSLHVQEVGTSTAKEVAPTMKK
ncbi:hypothetical protein QYF36_027188 [Acer negundo]|nr:hypothetical protein QYF36_027188 [Acer negundo]